MNPIHWSFDKLYPAIRFAYERVFGHPWFQQIEEPLWMGGAPTYERDYQFIVDHGINAVLDVRAERQNDLEHFEQNRIDHLKLEVLDVMVPPPEALDAGTEFIDRHIRSDDTVLVHCAKGRGRSATMVAAYLMRYHGYDYAQARELLVERRPLVNLQGRHQRALESWIQQYREGTDSQAVDAAESAT